ncbi:hypothetical protein G6F68_011663 [Rhizopus microsporus]|nr:hypothetical protein G6F68_011663 [Rhizopus microsporus]
MLRRTRPGGAVSQAIGLRTRRVDDLLHRIEGAVGPHDQRIADHAHQCHGREILDGVIAQRVDEERIDGMRGDGAAHQRVAVRLRAGHQLRADDAGHPRLVLDNHGLPQLRRQAFGQQSAHDVRRAARRKRHYDAYGTGGIRILGKRRVRDADAGQRDAGQ